MVGLLNFWKSDQEFIDPHDIYTDSGELQI